MSDINFKPVFDYFDNFKGEVNVRFDRIEERLKNVETGIDNLTKMVKTFQDEHIIMRKRLEVLEAWAKKVSEKVGIPLPF